MHHVVSCSMRILPFFNSIGYYKGSLLVDGCLSAKFTIPKDTNPNKIIRISPYIYKKQNNIQYVSTKF